MWDMESIVIWVNMHAPAWVLLLSGLMNCLVVLGSAYVAVSPSKSDDEKLKKLESMPVVGVLLAVLKAHSLVVKEDGKIQLSNKK